MIAMSLSLATLVSRMRSSVNYYGAIVTIRCRRQIAEGSKTRRLVLCH